MIASAGPKGGTPSPRLARTSFGSCWQAVRQIVLTEFIALVQNFRNLSEPDKIIHLGWFLHAHRKRERFNVDAVRQCFNELHLEVPRNLARDISRLAERKALL